MERNMADFPEVQRKKTTTVQSPIDILLQEIRCATFIGSVKISTGSRYIAVSARA